MLNFNMAICKCWRLLFAVASMEWICWIVTGEQNDRVYLKCIICARHTAKATNIECGLYWFDRVWRGSTELFNDWLIDFLPYLLRTERRDDLNQQNNTKYWPRTRHNNESCSPFHLLHRIRFIFVQMIFSFLKSFVIHCAGLFSLFSWALQNILGWQFLSFWNASTNKQSFCPNRIRSDLLFTLLNLFSGDASLFLFAHALFVCWIELK